MNYQFNHNEVAWTALVRTNIYLNEVDPVHPKVDIYILVWLLAYLPFRSSVHFSTEKYSQSSEVQYITIQ